MENPGKLLLRFSNAGVEKEFGPGPLSLEVNHRTDDSEIKVKKADGKIIGWARYTIEDRKVSLDNLFARKTNWHVGTSIVAALAGLESPLPIVVQPDAITRSYYEKMGFVNHPFEKGKLWLPDIKMLKYKFMIEKVKEQK